MDRPSAATLRREFLDRSVHHLREEYLPRIGRALEVLPAEDVWWRPNSESTSVANLLLHLEGNVRQWILSGVGGQPDLRRRSTEFDHEEVPERTAAEMFDALRTTVFEACRVIESLDDEDLLRRHEIQVFEGVTAAAAILHVVEHFAWHTGQIAYVAKMRSAQPLRYYDDEALE
jgi:uncharacterized damage-inducible protein DinB